LKGGQAGIEIGCAGGGQLEVGDGAGDWVDIHGISVLG
jgi:hypothetical protein